MTEPKKVEEKVKMAKEAFCKPFKFQVGDKVKTFSGKVGRVTAIGGFYIDGKFSSPVFRVGKKTYWYEWQLRGGASHVSSSRS